MSNRSENFVNYIIKKVQESKADSAALCRADNSQTEYQSWDILAVFGVNLEKEFERLPFAIVSASIARSKSKFNGKTSIGRAIAECYSEDNSSNQAKAKLGRLLACDSTEEACLILRQFLRLIESKSNLTLNYVKLLDDLLWFNHEESRQKIKASWAQNFYHKKIKETNNE